MKTLYKSLFIIAGIMVLALGLTACTSDGRIAIAPTVLPSQDPPIITPELVLLPVNLDAPRDKNGNIDLSSNIYRGFDREAYDNFYINQLRTDEYIRTLLLLIKQRNDLTQENTDKAKASLSDIKKTTETK